MDPTDPPAAEAERIDTVRDLLLVDPRRPLGERERQHVEEHKPRIAAAVGELRRGLKRLARALEHAPFAVVFEPEYDAPGSDRPAGYRRLGHGPSMEAAVSAYAKLELDMDDPVNAPVRCLGAIGVDDPRIIELAREVNRLKSVLKERFRPITNHRVTAAIKRRQQPVVTKIPMALYILRQLQLSSLNRLGAYRAIPLIRTEGKDADPPTPTAIRFTENWSQSIVRRTVQELIDEALAEGHSITADQLGEAGVPLSEYVYSPKRHYLRMRANLSFPGRERPSKYMAELPILFLMSAKLASPTVHAPRPRLEPGPRQRRRTPLQSDPIIATLPFYRRAREHDRVYADVPQRGSPSDR